MKKTAFVCYGNDKGHNPLVYQELPRRDSGEEFFVFFSPIAARHNEPLRELFRDAISISRLGHPTHYFYQFVQRFKELAATVDGASEMLKGVRIVIMIRRGMECYLFRNEHVEAMHWDGSGAAAEDLSQYEYLTMIPLKEVKEQGDLFEQPVEEMFVLNQFILTEGDHTILLIPSKDFFGRFREELRNSVLFPSFEIPDESGVDLEMDKTFPAIHWNTARETVRVEAPKRSRKFSIPALVGAATLVMAMIVLFMPRGEGERAGGENGGEPLLSAVDEAGLGEAARSAGNAVEESRKTGIERTISLAEAWKKGFDAPVTSSPVTCGDRVLFGCRDGSMYAFTQTGEMVWRYETGDGVGASPYCITGKVICANYSGDVTCLDLETGIKVWSFAARDKIVSSPRARGNMVLIATMQGNLMAFDLKDGRLLWAKKIGNEIWATSTIGKNYVIAATTDGSLVKLNHEGDILWSAKPGGGIRSTPLCLEKEDLVVFGTKDKYLYGYSLSGGDLMWRYMCGGEMNAPPVRAGSSILAGSEDGNLYAVSMNGQLVWRAALKGTILSKPYVKDDTAFVTAYNSKLFAVNTRNGEIENEFQASSPIYSSPHIDGDRIFFGSNGGIFYSLWIYGDKSQGS
jgi:outer membrane protein assembly factor BamB